jgi:hypothetical protein
MNAPSFPVSCLGLPDGLGGELVPYVESAAAALGLGEDLSEVRICGDDLPGDEGVWYRLEPGAPAAGLPALVLYCHGGCFKVGARPGDHPVPPRAVWEQFPAPKGDAAVPEQGISAERTAMFLHHHLLTAQDLVRGEIIGRNLPPTLAEAFAEAWAVRIDGRLARLGLPGYPPAECRSRFARIFSPAGILLPDHWQVFQSLWDGALENQKDVLRVVRRLPGL